MINDFNLINTNLLQECLFDLPTKEQIRAQLLGVLVSPATKLAQMISAPGASLARVINAHAEKDQEAA